jgi:hypothetical protein
MTAYELASLHAQISDNVNAQLTNFLTLLSLYLGAGYLIAHRLTLWSAIALTGIFVVVESGFSTVMYRTLASLIGLSREIRKLAEQGQDLQWHQAVGMPDWVLNWLPTNSLILLWVIVVAAVYFFFASRRHNMENQSPASASPPAPAAATISPSETPLQAT